MVQPATIDLTALGPILDQYCGRGRESLLPLLHEAQDVSGWLPREVLQAIGETLHVPWPTSTAWSGILFHVLQRADGGASSACV